MKKVLIDTNIWIDFLNKQNFAISLISSLSEKYEIYSSLLTVTELRAGWDNGRAGHFLPIFYSQTKILGISIEIAELAGKFRQEYKIKGISLPTIDTLIAATAILEKCHLVTRNKKDYPMKEIKSYEIPGI